jgi:hypothetical protein
MNIRVILSSNFDLKACCVECAFFTFQLNVKTTTVYKTENTAVEIRCADHAILSIRKSSTNFAHKRRSLSGFTSFAEERHGVFFR